MDKYSESVLRGKMVNFKRNQDFYYNGQSKINGKDFKKVYKFKNYNIKIKNFKFKIK